MPQRPPSLAFELRTARERGKRESRFRVLGGSPQQTGSFFFRLLVLATKPAWAGKPRRENLNISRVERAKWRHRDSRHFRLGTFLARGPKHGKSTLGWADVTPAPIDDPSRRIRIRIRNWPSFRSCWPSSPTSSRACVSTHAIHPVHLRRRDMICYSHG